MSAAAPLKAIDLFPRDSEEAFRTGEVLKHEFQLIHGTAAWNPSGLSPDETRQKLGGGCNHEKRPETEKANDEQEDADRLALHAWSVFSLGTPGQSALCLSGGGIRSAAFGLGILQGLARRGLLGQFHYLSTVSGGGYIASWLTAWRHRANEIAVLKYLKCRRFDEFNEPEPLARLRFNQNFLTPKLGIASADTWAAIGAVLRNLLLNWLVFLPLLAGLLLVPRVVEALFVWLQQSVTLEPTKVIYPSSLLKSLLGPWLPHVEERIKPITELGGWAGWRSWTDALAVVLIVLGFSVSAYNRPANGRTSLTQRGYVKRVALPVLVGAVLLAGAIASWADQMTGTWQEELRWALLGGMVYVLARLIAAVRAYSRFHDTPSKWTFPLELIGWAVAGMCTGFLIVRGAEFCHSVIITDENYRAVISKEELAKYLAAFGPPWIVCSFLLGEAVYTGVTSRLPYGERDREWLARASGWFGMFTLPYLVFSSLVLFGWPIVEQTRLQIVYLFAVGGSGLLSIFGALTPLTRPVARASREKFPVTKIVTLLSGLFILVASAWLSDLALDLLSGISRVVHRLSGDLSDCYGSFVICGRDQTFPPANELIFVTATSLVLLSFSAIVSFFINVNFFSLHALYRNRLVKTFLGASNVTLKPEGEHRNAFDGFSPRDNLAMAELHENMRVGAVKLYPVLNISLNLLATKNLAWQERKAESFVSTPAFTGAHRVGYRPSALYSAGWWGSFRQPQKGISLGTAMAISGAAVSPNWGYHSSPVTSFLMMLANVRLGAWLGNPKHRTTWRYGGPRFSWRLFLQEALGRTDDEEPWIYLSDGGHFENLGLYEMVRRRCRTIIVSDAGADPKCTLEDLGNAVRKIAVDLGVRIEFDRIYVHKRTEVATAGVYCAIGKIHYPEDPENAWSKIIYIRPGFYGTAEPADVRAYAAANAKFPHESTLNQWFGESQFESYRSLGVHIIEEICQKSAKSELSLVEFVGLVEEYLRNFADEYGKDGSKIVDLRQSRVTLSAA